MSPVRKWFTNFIPSAPRGQQENAAAEEQPTAGGADQTGLPQSAGAQDVLHTFRAVAERWPDKDPENVMAITGELVAKQIEVDKTRSNMAIAEYKAQSEVKVSLVDSVFGGAIPLAGMVLLVVVATGAGVLLIAHGLGVSALIGKVPPWMTIPALVLSGSAVVYRIGAYLLKRSRVRSLNSHAAAPAVAGSDPPPAGAAAPTARGPEGPAAD